MLAGLEQTLAFQKGMRGHDDAPDADEGAISLSSKATHGSVVSLRRSAGGTMQKMSW